MDEGRNLISRTLSAMAWAHSEGVRELFHIGSNGRDPVRVGKGDIRHPSHAWEHLYLPQPKKKPPFLAFALFPRALDVDRGPHQFLRLFKILNNPLAKDATQD